MSNDTTTPDDGVHTTPPMTRRRALWVATGVAGLTGVVGLAALGGLAARHDSTDDRSAGTQQNVSDAGGARNERTAEQGDERTDPGQGDERTDRRADDRVDDGGPDGRPRGDRNGPEGRDGGGRVEEVPCDPDRLIAAINRANAEHGAALRLAKRCTYVLTVTDGVSGLPTITEPIAIEGERSTIVRAANAAAFRIFTVANGGRLTLTDLTLRGGQSTTGAALLVETGGTAELKGTTVTDNNAAEAIRNEGTTELERSSVVRNVATGIANTGLLRLADSAVAYNSGSGIANEIGTTWARKSSIDHNRSLNGGGGISADGGIVHVEESAVADNTATGDGGGIDATGGAQLTLRNVKLVRNAAGGNGGGLALAFGTALMDGGEVAGNTATGLGGGGFTDVGSTLTAQRSEIAANRANSGGGLYNSGATVHLVGAKVVRNVATVDGGGIYTTTATVTVDQESTIVANRPNNCVGPVPDCFG